MKGNIIFKKYLSFVYLFPCLTITIISLLVINHFLYKFSIFENESDFNDEDSNEMSHKDSN